MDRQPLTDRLGDRLLAEYGGAAAAYSLRALNGNGDSVVRVRRASDNDEKDFTAEQIELGEMVNWVNSQTVPPLDIGIETEDGRIPVPEGGETIGTPAAAYSLRNLSTTYTGNVVDVRRSSDDAEESFTAAEVSDGTLESWVGAGNNGTVSKWYDQSGNDNHAVQTTPANQPTIVEGGSLVTDGGKATMDATDGWLSKENFTIGNASGQYSSFIIGQRYTDVSGRAFWGMQTADAWGLTNTPNANEMQLAGVTATGYNTTNTNLNSQFNDGTNTYIFRDGSLVGSGTTTASPYTSPSTSTLRIGSGRFNDRTIASSLQEIIIYNSDQSDNRTAIEANIGETYGITGIPAYDNTVDGFVETWYDQSGNGRDATQSVAGNQPKIVDGGSLVAGGLDFDGVDDYLLGAHNVTSDYSFFTVTNDTGSLTSYIADTGSTSGNGVNYGRTVDSSGNRQLTLGNGGFGAVNASGFLVGESLISQTYDSTTINASVNGSAVGTSIQGYTASGTTLTVGASGSFGASFNGTMKELILYPSDQSATRTAIEDNINAHYNIYP